VADNVIALASFGDAGVQDVEVTTRSGFGAGVPMTWNYVEKAREGDHICYISNLKKLREHYPNWSITKTLDDIFVEISEAWVARAQ